LIPSFSSTVGGDVGEVFTKVKDQLTDSCLVSAFDLAHNIIDPEEIWYSTNVFVDCGVYENRILNKDHPRRWSLSHYQKVVDRLKIKGLSNLILVSYDDFSSFHEQVVHAQLFFDRYPDAKRDFLLKPPSKEAKIIDFEELLADIRMLANFHVLGITEKEIGRSILERCQAIVKIRTSMTRAGINIPIHVFGCLDPLSILSYFLCGADIFDGLVWLRHGFHQNLAMYPSNFTILKKQWTRPDESALPLMYVTNLEKLSELMFIMKRIGQNHDLNRLDRLLGSDVLQTLTELIDSADIKVVGE